MKRLAVESLWQACGIAVAATAAALGVWRLAPSPEGDPALVALLLASVALSARFAGGRAARAAAVLGLAGLAVFSPRPVEFVAMLFYAVAAALTVSLSAARERSVQVAEELLREAQARREQLNASAAACRQAEQNAEAFLSLASIGVGQTDPETGRLLRVNAKLCEITGYSEAELLGMRFVEFTHPEDRERNLAEFQSAVRGEKPAFMLEKRYVRKDGGIRWLLVHGSVVRGETGRPERVVAVVVDITERKKAEMALQERESQLRQIGDSLPDGFLYEVMTAPDGDRRFFYFSAGVERMTGVPMEEALRDAQSLYGLVHPDDLPRVTAAEVRCMQERCSYDVQIRFRNRATGEWRWVHLRSAPRALPDGRFIWDGIYLDITKNKQTEDALARTTERLDLAQRASRIGVFDWEIPSGKVVWNEEEERMFGLPPGSFGGNIEHWRERVHSEDLQRVRQEFASAMERRDAEIEFSYRITRMDGAVRWLDGRARFFYDESGRPLRMVGVNMDVTDRRAAMRESERLLERERAARAEAEAASQAKDRFLAVLSHEMRTPLAPVAPLVAHWMERDDLSPELRADLQTIHRNVQLEARLIDDLLDLSRITQGKLALREEMVDLHDVIAHTASICCTDEVRARGVDVRLDLQAAHHRVRGDAARLEQILWNLVNNACKFSPPGKEVEVSTRNADAMIVAEVRDFGRGVPPEFMDKLFKPFEQHDRDFFQRQQGLGLGLAISKSLTEQHGGVISARNAPDGGAIFQVQLPLAARQEAPAASQNGGRPAPAARVARTARILLVEDHPDTAAVMSRLLTRQGHAVTLARSKTEALEAAGRETFDLLISDMALPDGTGLDVMARIRENAPVPGIALSGFGMESDLQRSREAGFAEHLVKPVDFPQLLAAIGRLVPASDAQP